MTFALSFQILSIAPETAAATLLCVIAKRKPVFRPAAAARTAALLERKELLIEEAQHLSPGSFRRRCEIEGEIAEIQWLLKGLWSTENNLNACL
jgi:hypothetical protein